MATVDSSMGGGARGGRRRRRLQQKDWAPYVFLAPMLFFLVVFFLAPIGFSLYLSLTRWNPLSTPSSGIDTKPRSSFKSIVAVL